MLCLHLRTVIDWFTIMRRLTQSKLKQEAALSGAIAAMKQDDESKIAQLVESIKNKEQVSIVNWSLVQNLGWKVVPLGHFLPVQITLAFRYAVSVTDILTVFQHIIH